MSKCWLSRVTNEFQLQAQHRECRVDPGQEGASSGQGAAVLRVYILVI